MRMRKRLFVDRKVQGALMLRAVEYWFCCVVTIALGTLAWNLITGPDQPLWQFFVDTGRYFLPTAVVSLLILPLLVYDILKLSNKFTGPLYRLRRELRRLAAGEKVASIHFRVGDYWLELADEFNAVAQRMDMLTNRAEDGRKTTEPNKLTGEVQTAPPQLSVAQRSGSDPYAVTVVKSAAEGYPLRDRLGELPKADRTTSGF